ncbi:hypothetical protein MMC25_001968 [Agyrium rufum]|nr:hypothetical protein [Agyrium rufum]
MASVQNKKRKRPNANGADDGVDTSKPTAVFQPSEGRLYTLSIALPGSIIANAQSHELKTALAGHIARAAAVFCVDEIVIFDDGQCKSAPSNGFDKSSLGGDKAYTGYSDPVYFLTHLLSYLETPPYLRKRLFPLHPDLRNSGTLPSLDMPHHFRAHERCKYREGVVLETPGANGTISTSDQGASKKSKKSSKKTTEATPITEPSVSTVDAGLPKPVQVDGFIPPSTRVTLKFQSTAQQIDFYSETMTAEPVPPSEPRERSGYYWGYSVRSAASLSTVLTECEFDGGYDLTVGTSERGVDVSSLTGGGPKAKSVPDFKHLLIVFGGVAGLEVAFKADNELAGMELDGPEKLFDYWVNLVPGQGSRTIRTEEAVWLGLMGLRDLVTSHGLKS